MRVYYTDQFALPLPEGHRFPMSKYTLLRQRVAASGLVPHQKILIPPPLQDEAILRAHDSDYLRRVQQGELSIHEIRKIGFPWSPEMVERSFRSSSATLESCRAALQEGVAVNLAGGTHHAFRDHGGGYCVFNDSAIAALNIIAEGHVKRVVIIDCDVHQGDGTAAILVDNPDIYTFSIHAEKNYPFHKQKSDLDISLDDGTTDAVYLARLAEGLEYALEESQAELAIYLAGADPYEHDKLGRLSLTKAGLRQRDEMVLENCRTAGIPVAITMAGGYAKNVEDIVDIHFQTVATAAQIFNEDTHHG